MAIRVALLGWSVSGSVVHKNYALQNRSNEEMAKQIRKHKPLIINWFEAKGQFSSGVVEGFNKKSKLTMRKSYGFKSPDTIEIALYHALGALPEPKSAHRFF